MFSVVAFVVNIPIAFLVPSSSGHAALVMPIIAPLADFADVGRDIAVTAYQSASGLVNLVTPTSAIIDRLLAGAKPISDIRASAEYRLEMFRVIADRAIRKAVARLDATSVGH